MMYSPSSLRGPELPVEVKATYRWGRYYKSSGGPLGPAVTSLTTGPISKDLSHEKGNGRGVPGRDGIV
jgi:hypothetical protein